MSKYSFLIYHKEYEDFLHRLRDLGVVHVVERQDVRQVSELSQFVEERNVVSSLLKALKPFEDQERGEAERQESLALSLEAGRADLESLQTTLSAYEAQSLELQTLREMLRERTIWGEFEPKIVDERLAEAGYRWGYYSIATSQFTDEYADSIGAILIAKAGLQSYFVRLEEASSTPLPEAERISAPEKSIQQIEGEIQQAEAELAQLTESLSLWANRDRSRLEAYDRLLANSYALGATRLQASPEADAKLMVLEGWVPTPEAKGMEQALGQLGYYYQPMEITDEDVIPIKLKNNAFARLFEPITKMYSLPNYGEIDQTVFLAPFFLLFFGMCLGDGGYGLLLFALGTFLRLRSKDEDKSTYTLLQVLGIGAAIIGGLMGSFFGVMAGYAEDKSWIFHQDNMMLVALVVGFAQILFARSVAAYKAKVQRGWKHALSHFGWVALLLGLIVMILSGQGIVLPEVFQYVIYGIVGISTLLVLFYNSPGKGVFANLGSGLWATYNNASGLLGDLLSYLRLFAIGLTGGILGGVFNMLAIEQTEGLPWYVRFPLMLVILLAGHGLNFALAMISSFVHPIRLTFVEYYKNSEFEGGGKAYKPFSQQ